jgi:hypothetical protein
MHGGAGLARNVAAKHVKTELLLPLDCDDILVPDAVRELVKRWKGVPVYPDLFMFGKQSHAHYQMMDFTCSIAENKLGFSSVCVLHSKEQWRSLDGWRTDLRWYEDGEYNARLMLTYCGLHVRQPLYGYRVHDYQTSKTIPRIEAKAYADEVLQKARSSVMGCPCKGKKFNKNIFGGMTMTQSNGDAMASFSIPGATDEPVLAQYVGGKGMAAHYYRGPKTRFAYKVEHGNFYRVDPRDVVYDPNQTGVSLFLAQAQSEPVVEEEKVVEEGVRTARQEPATRQPVEDTLPDIANMTINAVKGLPMTPDLARKLLAIEQRGKNRHKLVTYLQVKSK